MGQTLYSQPQQLRGAGCSSWNIYRGKATGAHLTGCSANWSRRCGDGDPHRRLARSTFDLFGIVKRIVDAKKQFRSLAEPWPNTRTITGRLMLAVLDGLADVERDLIRTRTTEGRSRAKARGQPMGPPFPDHRPNRKRPSGNATWSEFCDLVRMAAQVKKTPEGFLRGCSNSSSI